MEQWLFFCIKIHDKQDSPVLLKIGAAHQKKFSQVPRFLFSDTVRKDIDLILTGDIIRI